jgi:two-component system, chemotaxis family, protein-glutamate methylesterase/glutaminase
MTNHSGASSPGVVALGASAGGIDALQRTVADLPGDLPVAVCVVLHIPATPRSVLADILARRTVLSVRPAHDGDLLRAGHIYVAPPDHHLLVASGRVRLDRGPKENGARPAIDPLFRSVATECGPRRAAVVLSGSLADGAAGAAAVAAAGGTVIVQEPKDAGMPSMPEAALAAVPTARTVAAQDLGALIAALAHGLDAAHHDGREATVSPNRIQAVPHARTGRPEGPPSGLTCPECHGPLWERETNGVIQFRCRVGHTFADEVLLEAKDGEVEAAMWSAIEALEEHAELIRKVAGRMADSGRDHAAAMLRRRADDTDRRAERLRSVVGAAEIEHQPETA